MAQSTDIESLFASLKEEAFKQAPELKVSELNQKSALAARYSTFTNLLPQLNAQISQNHYKGQSLTGLVLPPGFANPSAESDVGSLGLNVSLPLFNRGSWLALGQARAQSEIAEQQLLLRQREFDSELRRVTGNYLLALYREFSMTSTLEAARSLLRETRLRFELGTKSRLDVLRSEANLASLESRQATLSLASLDRRNELASFAGVTSERLQELGLDQLLSNESQVGAAIDRFVNPQRFLDRLSAELSLSPASLETTVIEKNARYKVLLAQESLARSQARMAMNAEWPALSLGGTWAKQGESLKDARTADATYSYGLTLSVPLFASGRLVSSYREASARVEAAGVERGRAVMQLLQQVRSRQLQILTLQRSLKSIETQVKQNEELLRLTRKSFELQKSSSLELLISQNDLLSSKIDFAESKIRLADALRDFALATGANVE